MGENVTVFAPGGPRAERQAMTEGARYGGHEAPDR